MDPATLSNGPKPGPTVNRNPNRKVQTMTKINTTFTVTNTTTYKTTTVKGFVLNGILHVGSMALAEAQGATRGNSDHDWNQGLPVDYSNNHRDLVARYNGNRIQFVVVDRIEVWTGSFNMTINGAYRNNNNLLQVRSREIAENYLREFEEMYIQKVLLM